MDDSNPSTYLSDHDLQLLQQAGGLIMRGKELKGSPADLRLVLVDIQAVRFEIGRRLAKFRGHARDAFREAYNANKDNKMSPNAAYKESETDEKVIRCKNSRDILETAYETLQSFVNTNQTSLGIAKEEAKNNL